MSLGVKSEVLRELEQHKGIFLSGGRLAEALNVSRNAVWKAIRSLEQEGHQIQAVPNKGYCLSLESAVLSREGIEQHLRGAAGSLQISVQKEVTSTNTVLKKLAEEGKAEGAVLAADRQTLGKGRSGRSFYSPSDSGIYFSILLRPKCSKKDALLITTAAAVATAEGIEAVTGIQTGIKWVNDLFCRGKKVCGILTEASVDFESGGLSYAVLGIGINVNDPKEGFPEEIRDVAGSLFGREHCGRDIRCRLVGEILSVFMEYYGQLTSRCFMDAYRERSLVIGKEVEAYSGEKQETVKVLDIDDDGRLIVLTEDGMQKRLDSGEIRIRPVTKKEFDK